MENLRPRNQLSSVALGIENTSKMNSGPVLPSEILPPPEPFVPHQLGHLHAEDCWETWTETKDGRSITYTAQVCDLPDIEPPPYE